MTKKSRGMTKKNRGMTKRVMGGHESERVDNK
jgi:hypothetical protein